MKQPIVKHSIFILFILLLTACGGNTNKSSVQEEVAEDGTVKAQKVVDKYDLLTQDGYEKFLADWNIPLPKYSSLDTLAVDEDGGYSIAYNMEPFSEDSVQALYEKVFDEQLLENGWSKPLSGYTIQGTLYMNVNTQEYIKFFHMSLDDLETHQIGFIYGEM